MVEILELPKPKKQSSSQLLQRNELLSDRIRQGIAASFRVVERDVIPLLNEIKVSLERAICDANPNAVEPVLLDGALESARSVEDLVRKVQLLIDCYQMILVCEPGDGDS